MRVNKQLDKDRVFGFLKKYITLSMVSILVVISGVFFVVYHNLEISRVTDNSGSILLQLSSSCDSLFDSIRKLSFQIYNDGDIASLVNQPDPDITTARRSYGRLGSYSSSVTNIISIYIYGRQNDNFYTTFSSLPKQSRMEFFDTEAVDFINNIQSVKNSQKVKVLYPIPRKIKLYGAPDVPNNTINAYTFIYYGVPKFLTGYLNKAVIINVSEEWVKNSVNSWNKDIKGNICIMNEDGIMVSTLYRDEMLQDISKDKFAARILKSKKESGSFICDVSGTKSFVTFVYSKSLHWFFIHIVSYSSIYDNLKKIGFITGLMLLLYIAIGFSLSYLVTGKAKKSIDDIIDGLKQQIRDSRSDMEKLKDEFLFNSLYNNITVSPEQTCKDFAKYNIALLPDRMILLVLLRIDHYNELCTRFKSYEITLLRQAVIKAAGETFKEQYTFEAVDMKGDLMVLILNDRTSSEHLEFGKIDDMIKMLQDSAEKNVQLSLTAVLGPAGYTFNDISLLYTEVKQASNHRMFCGHKCIIHSEELRTLNSEDFAYPAEKEKMLLDTLMLGKIDSSSKLLDEILYSTKGYPHTVLNSLLLRLTASISSTFEGIESISKYSVDYNFNSFVAALSGCETIDEIRSRFYDMLGNVFAILDQKKNSKYGLLINNAIDFINQNYSDPNLCLGNIASKLGISPGYLGRLFRTYTSKSVADYITKIRVDIALQMLEECTMPVNHIAAAAGFSSKNYFYTVFKRIVGVTPSDYRQKVKTNSTQSEA